MQTLRRAGSGWCWAPLALTVVTWVVVLPVVAAEPRPISPSPPVSANELRAIADRIDEAAQMLDERAPEELGGRCEQKVMWRSRWVSPKDMIVQGCRAGPGGQRGWSKDQDWALQLPSEFDRSSCGELGSLPNSYEGQCSIGVCLAVRDTILPAFRDDAQNLRTMANTLDCLVQRADRFNQEQRQFAVKQREEEAAAQRAEEAEAQRLEHQRLEEQRDREREATAELQRAEVEAAQRREQARLEEQARREAARQEIAAAAAERAALTGQLLARGGSGNEAHGVSRLLHLGVGGGGGALPMGCTDGSCTAIGVTLSADLSFWPVISRWIGVGLGFSGDLGTGAAEALSSSIANLGARAEAYVGVDSGVSLLLHYGWGWRLGSYLFDPPFGRPVTGSTSFIVEQKGLGLRLCVEAQERNKDFCRSDIAFSAYLETPSYVWDTSAGSPVVLEFTYNGRAGRSLMLQASWTYPRSSEGQSVDSDPGVFVLAAFRANFDSFEPW